MKIVKVGLQLGLVGLVLLFEMTLQAPVLLWLLISRWLWRQRLQTQLVAGVSLAIFLGLVYSSTVWLMVLAVLISTWLQDTADRVLEDEKLRVWVSQAVLVGLVVASVSTGLSVVTVVYAAVVWVTHWWLFQLPRNKQRVGLDISKVLSRQTTL